MLSTRSLTLIRGGIGHHVAARTVGATRNFTSPAIRRFRAKKQNKFTQRNTEMASSATSFSLPHTYQEMDNSTLLTVGAMGNHDARIEILKRHIMSVDRCSYDEATMMYEKIAKKNREGMAIAALPYQIGIVAGVSSALASIPMVFDLSTTLWFNEFFVTTEVPGAEDLETSLEVGSWAWNWMEPPLGTMSFALLALQFSRAQMDNLGIRPYTRALKKRRGKALAKAFPDYNSKVIMDFSETDKLMKINL